MSPYDAQFPESKALLAAQEQDLDTVRAVLAELLPGERHALYLACSRLMGEISHYKDQEGTPQ